MGYFVISLVVAHTCIYLFLIGQKSFVGMRTKLRNKVAQNHENKCAICLLKVISCPQCCPSISKKTKKEPSQNKKIEVKVKESSESDYLKHDLSAISEQGSSKEDQSSSMSHSGRSRSNQKKIPLKLSDANGSAQALVSSGLESPIPLEPV